MNDIVDIMDLVEEKTINTQHNDDLTYSWHKGGNSQRFVLCIPKKMLNKAEYNAGEHKATIRYSMERGFGYILFGHHYKLNLTVASKHRLKISCAKPGIEQLKAVFPMDKNAILAVSEIGSNFIKFKLPVVDILRHSEF